MLFLLTYLHLINWLFEWEFDKRPAGETPVLLKRGVLLGICSIRSREGMRPLTDTKEIHFSVTFNVKSVAYVVKDESGSTKVTLAWQIA